MSTERIIVDAQDRRRVRRQARQRAPRRCRPAIRAAMSCSARSISIGAAERMDELIADAVGKGAKVVAGGKRTGTVVEATVLDHVTPAMRIYHEESFGPVKPVDPRQRRGGGDPRRQRHRIRPVGRGLQPRHPARAARSPGASSPASATSTARPCTTRRRCRSAASKASGYGRFGGKAAIDEFTELRWITIEEPKQHYPF